MKIAVVSSTVFPCPPSGYAGLEMIAYLCATGLANKGHDVTLIAPDGSSCPGGKVFTIGPPGAISEQHAYGGYHYNVPNAEQLPENERVKYHDPYWPVLLEQDCVIDHSWQKWAYMLRAEKRLKAPVLSVMHAPINTMLSVWPPRFPGHAQLEKACAVCISDDQRQHFEALFSPCKAMTCYNGVDTSFYHPLDIPRTKRFLFLARFSSIKGADLAIEACREAGVGLDLIGDTSITNEPEFFDECRSMCDGEQIRMIGPATRGETVYWYSQAHAMLHPNQRFREPFGLAPVEAQLCGCPVLGWSYGAMQETVTHGVTGFLVDSLPDLIQLIRSNAVTTIDRSACRELASRFSVDRMVDRYHELCLEAVESGGW